MINTLAKLKYIIFDMSEIDKIDFSKVKENSKNTLMVSIDGTKSFVHWDTDAEPAFVSTLTSKSQYYNNDEMIAITRTEEWLKNPYTGI
jgi:hypothetical protein